MVIGMSPNVSPAGFVRHFPSYRNFWKNMQLDNISVSRKLWGLSGSDACHVGDLRFQQYRANNSMASAMGDVIDIEERISMALRWRGGTETAVNMVMGAAVTSDSVLAEQYNAKVKTIIGDITKIQGKDRGRGDSARKRRRLWTRCWRARFWPPRPRPGSSKAGDVVGYAALCR